MYNHEVFLEILILEDPMTTIYHKNRTKLTNDKHHNSAKV
jgi:hypothetical protein